MADSKELLATQDAQANASSPQDAERTLQRIIEMLDRMGTMARVGGWEVDLLTQQLTLTQENYRIFDLDPETPPTFDAMLGQFDPARSALFRERIQATLRDGTPWSREVFITTRKGNSRWIRSQGTAVFENGKAVRLMGTVQDITEQKTADLTFQENLERYHRTLDDMLEGCQIIDYQWRYVYLNNTALGHARQSAEQLLGRTMMECYPGIDQTPLFDTLRNCMENRVAHNMENIFTFPDGSLGAFELRIAPVPDGIFILSMDITERKRTQAALFESERRYRQIVESAHEGILQVDENGIITFANAKLAEMLGYSVDELIGISPLTFVDPADHVHVPERLERRRQGISERLEVMFLRKDGSRIWVLANASPVFDAEGRYAGALSMLTDITDRRSTELALEEHRLHLEREVQARTMALEAANKELEAFSYSVSHDLRAPLRAINGFARIVAEDFGPQLPADAQDYLRDIQAATQQMGRLVDDLLAFARLSRQPLTKQTLTTKTIVQHCLNTIRSDVGAQSAEVLIDELPSCQADPALLKQVWLNLLSNALKYSAKRPNPQIHIGCEQKENELIFWIRDNGVGFDMRYAQKLFGVFQRLHRAEEYEGTGVGLAIVERIVHRHGGRIWAEAELNRGATFYFSLPLLPATD